MRIANPPLPPLATTSLPSSVISLSTAPVPNFWWLFLGDFTWTSVPSARYSFVFPCHPMFCLETADFKSGVIRVFYCPTTLYPPRPTIASIGTPLGYKFLPPKVHYPALLFRNLCLWFHNPQNFLPVAVSELKFVSMKKVIIFTSVYYSAHSIRRVISSMHTTSPCVLFW